jgi:hypothetical protein
MKKAFIIILAVMTLALLPASACSAGKLAVQLGQEFQLRPGQQASITGHDLNIAFIRVTEESRCPTGVT